MRKVKTCEFVTPKHPDKICDYIADSILDEYLKADPQARVAVEVAGGHNLIVVNGEVTSTTKIDAEKIVRTIVDTSEAKGKRLSAPAVALREGWKIIIHIVKQSPFIAQGVDSGGAGDQGIMLGYATSETKSKMPFEYETARTLCQQIFKVYPYDGKVQVTVEGKKIKTVVASFQNSKTKDLTKLVKKLIKADEYLINPAGEWTLGGFDADTGLSGRKLIVDNYGPEHPIGGGSFSGKDPTKVDRSGAYMARRIAVEYLNKYKAKEVQVKLAYAIGKAEAVMAIAIIDGKEIEIKDFDLRPQAMIKLLDLQKPIYAKTCQWGHFGRGFNWL